MVNFETTIFVVPGYESHTPLIDWDVSTVSTRGHGVMKYGIENTIVSYYVIAFLLMATGITSEAYQERCGLFSELLTPATVCLGIPLYKQIRILKKNIREILMGTIAGVLINLTSICGLAKFFHVDSSLYVSLLPKSITTALGIAVSEMNGGIRAITISAIIFTGILGMSFGKTFCKWMNFTEPVAQGVAFGTSSHVVGTAKAYEMHPTSGAVSSLSLVLAGIITVILFPLFLDFIE